MLSASGLIAFTIGALIVLLTLGSAVRSVVLPRGVRSQLSRLVTQTMRLVFSLWVGQGTRYERLDRVMARFAPLSLVVLVFVWEASVLIGFALMYWGLDPTSITRALALSGSSITTLGFERAEGIVLQSLTFLEAALGLFILALLITFLPSLYGAFARRESMVALLEVRAGSPPSVGDMIYRYHRIHGLDRLSELWRRWEVWFAELEESHTTFPTLPFFRSPTPQHSWITAAGAILDTASFRSSSLDLPRDPEAELCIRAGYIALRRIAAVFGIEYDEDPAPSDPISIERHEFDAVWDRLKDQGIPLKQDREQAWRDFAGWRVNYDAVLTGLAGYVMAPMAPWSSDRAGLFWRYKRTGGPPKRIR